MKKRSSNPIPNTCTEEVDKGSRPSKTTKCLFKPLWGDGVLEAGIREEEKMCCRKGKRGNLLSSWEPIGPTPSGLFLSSLNKKVRPSWMKCSEGRQLRRWRSFHLDFWTGFLLSVRGADRTGGLWGDLDSGACMCSEGIRPSAWTLTHSDNGAHPRQW